MIQNVINFRLKTMTLKSCQGMEMTLVNQYPSRDDFQEYLCIYQVLTLFKA